MTLPLAGILRIFPKLTKFPYDKTFIDGKIKACFYTSQRKEKNLSG